MELRKHPQMRWQGRPNWPPQWTGPHGPDNPLPQGEVGILTRVETAVENAVASHCVLVIHYNGWRWLVRLGDLRHRFSSKFFLLKAIFAS